MRRAGVFALLVVAVGCSRGPSVPVTMCDKEAEVESYECLVAEAESVSDRVGIESAEKHVREWFADSPHLAAAWCHSVMHELGHYWVDKHGDVGSVFSVPYSCAGGVLHGSFTAWAERGGDLTVLREHCGSLSEKNPAVLVWDCWHGLGHAIGVLIDDPRKAGERCAGVKEKWQEACVSGVYSAVGSRMADGDHHEEGHTPLSKDPSWCQGTSGVAYSLCWERQGILSARDVSFVCPSGGLSARQCAYGLGRGQGQVLLEGGRWDRGWIEKANNVCLSSAVPSRCFDGVVYEAVLHGEGRAQEEVCVLLSTDLGPCLLESGNRRSFEIQETTNWVIEPLR